MRYLISTILIFAFSSALLAQEEESPDWTFKSKDIRAAIRQYGRAVEDLNNKGEAALKKLEDGYKGKVKEQRLELLVEFEKALDEATESKDLDEAIKIRNAIKALHGGAEPPGVPAGLVFGGGSGQSDESPNDWIKHLLGQWKTRAGIWTFHRDGRVIQTRNALQSDGLQGRWEKKDSRIIIRWRHKNNSWDTLDFPLNQKTVSGDSWVGPDHYRATKIR